LKDGLRSVKLIVTLFDGICLMTFRNWVEVAEILLALTSLGPQAYADDPAIPERCRLKAAGNDAKCEEIIQTQFVERNARFNKRDKKLNADLKTHILESPTKTGGTVSASLSYASQQIPFAITGWNFVYARSGAEYVVLEFGSKGPDRRSAEDKALSLAMFFDDDRDDVLSVPDGFAAWKVVGKTTKPFGSAAEMLALDPQAFVHTVNAGRNGSSQDAYSEEIDRDYSFLSRLGGDVAKLSHYVDFSGSGTFFTWDAETGPAMHSKEGPCPAEKIDTVTVSGTDCEARANFAREITGRVLPFHVIMAIRNHGFGAERSEAAISISVDEGEPGDWLATAIYVAEHSLVLDAAFAKVEVFVPNPWGDNSPTGHKILATVYYDPTLVISKPKEEWLIIGAKKAGTPADIEYDKLSNDLIEEPAEVPDPELRMQRAEAAAKKAVVKKYGLPADWQPTENLGLDGQTHDRNHIRLINPDPDDKSTVALLECLTSNRGSRMFQGCMPPRD
jgi:hypothetical protein